MIALHTFSEFTFSKQSHFDYFKKQKISLAKEKVNPATCDLKRYQDLLVAAFISANIQPGAKILEIGGGNSRIIQHFKRDHECWNLDKLAGLGNGPRHIFAWKYTLIRDYIGNYNRQLPNTYFDFVFSISVLEHLPEHDPEIYKNVLCDMDRVLKPGGIALHCIDIILHPDSITVHPFIPFLFAQQRTQNPAIDFSLLCSDADLYFMSEGAYDQHWRKYTGKTYQEYGKPLSYNVLWQKPNIK